MVYITGQLEMFCNYHIQPSYILFPRFSCTIHDKPRIFTEKFQLMLITGKRKGASKTAGKKHHDQNGSTKSYPTSPYYFVHLNKQPQAVLMQ